MDPIPIQVLVSAGATLLSAVVGMWNGNRISRRSAERGEILQRGLLGKLLVDEIELRWDEISPDFAALGKLPPMDRLATLITTPIREDDFPVMKAIRDKFWDFHFLGNKEFVSSIIFAVVRLRDLIEAQTRATVLLAAWKESNFNYTELEPRNQQERKLWRDIRSLATDVGTFLGDLEAAIERVRPIVAALSPKQQSLVPFK